MKSSIEELGQIVNKYFVLIGDIPEKEFSLKSNPGKWSRKEVLGHLIDSGHNNLRRFICGQYESDPRIVYDQDFWVKVNDYQNRSSRDVIESWRLINMQIISVLSSMTKENYTRTANTGKTEVSLHSLEWLAADYIRHMKHHLNQIIAGSFDIVYK